MNHILPSRTGFVSAVMQRAGGHEYTLEFRKVTGELDHSNSYQVFRVQKDKFQEYVGSLNELYFYPEKKLIVILSRGEMQAISDVMVEAFNKSEEQRITSVTNSNNKS